MISFNFFGIQSSLFNCALHLVMCNQHHTSHPLEQIPISSTAYTQTALFFRSPPGLTEFYSKRLNQEHQIIPNQILISPI